MPIMIKRGGVSSPYNSLEANSHPNLSQSGSNIHLQFQLASKGGGTTVVEVLFAPDQFSQLAILMASADRKAAAQAFSAGVARLA